MASETRGLSKERATLIAEMFGIVLFVFALFIMVWESVKQSVPRAFLWLLMSAALAISIFIVSKVIRSRWE